MRTFFWLLAVRLGIVGWEWNGVNRSRLHGAVSLRCSDLWPIAKRDGENVRGGVSRDRCHAVGERA